jgi:hypothetical protein
MYDQEIFSDQFLIRWHMKKKKLDKESMLHDRKSEAEFREGMN